MKSVRAPWWNGWVEKWKMREWWNGRRMEWGWCGMNDRWICEVMSVMQMRWWEKAWNMVRMNRLIVWERKEWEWWCEVWSWWNEMRVKMRRGESDMMNRIEKKRKWRNEGSEEWHRVESVSEEGWKWECIEMEWGLREKYNGEIEWMKGSDSWCD